MDFQPPKKLLENLDGGETLITGIKNVRLGARPDYFFLTDIRIIYFDEKHLGRYDLSSIPFSKLQEVSAQIGPIRYGSLKITSEEGVTIDLNKIPKGGRGTLRHGSRERDKLHRRRADIHQRQEGSHG